MVTNANNKKNPVLSPKNATDTPVHFENVNSDVEFNQLDRSRSFTPSSTQGGSGEQQLYRYII